MFPFGTAIPTTSSDELKTLNSLCIETSFKFPSSIPNLISGLSQPYLDIARSYVILGKSSTLIFLIELKRCLTSPSNVFSMSSWLTKDISQSI